MISLDMFGAIISFVATVGLVFSRNFAWPLSVVAEICNLILYGKRGIYGDSGLEFLYLLLTLYGWYWWWGAKKHHERVIHHISRFHFLMLLAIGLGAIPILIYVLKNNLNSSVPYLDAVTTVISLQGQWLMCRKIIQGWAFWFVVDVIYIFLYAIKGIPYHGLLSISYLILAFAGYWRWQKLIKAGNNIHDIPNSSQTLNLH